MSDFIQSLTKKSQYESDEIRIQKIDVNLIQSDEDQVRGIFDEEKIEELADSIKSKGLLNPIHVRLAEEEYIILTGERRYRACKIAGLGSIPCIVHEENMTISEIRSLQLIENLQRQDLSALETARAFENLIKNGLKKRTIAVNLGISEATVSKHTTILSKIPKEWIKNLEDTKKDVYLNDLYAIAKERNKTKKAINYKKLLEHLGAQLSLEIEEKEEEYKKTKKKQQQKTDFTEDELLAAWNALIKEKRKDLNNLAQYISPKKLQTLIEKDQE